MNILEIYTIQTKKVLECNFLTTYHWNALHNILQIKQFLLASNNKRASSTFILKYNIVAKNIFNLMIYQNLFKIFGGIRNRNKPDPKFKN